MVKMKFNESVALLLTSTVALLGVMLGIDRWTNINAQGPITFVVLAILGLPLIYIVYLFTFRANQMEKKDYAAVFMVFAIIILFGIVLNKFGIFPTLFSAGIEGLQSMMGL